MAITLPTVFTLGSKSGVSDAPVHSGVNELNDDYNSRDRGGNHDDNLRISIEQVEWGEYNPYLSFIRRNSGFRFNIHSPHSWRSLYTRNSDESSKSSVISNRDRQRNRHYLYYGLLISLLSVAPVRANEGETNNTSNPVAAATGNVTNQAVQFQNNGAPSRQVYGPNISCNGSTMTFSPFYMGNHTKPWDIDDGTMSPSSYTMAENWGGQINFMVPLDREGLRRCRAIAAQQHEKMKLNYELVRIDNCAKLQQKGFMLLPGSRVYHLCSDVIPIAAWKKAEQKVLKCNLPPKPWYKPWNKPKETCTMSTFSDKRAKDLAKAKEAEEKKEETKESE